MVVNPLLDTPISAKPLYICVVTVLSTPFLLAACQAAHAASSPGIDCSEALRIGATVPTPSQYQLSERITPYSLYPSPSTRALSLWKITNSGVSQLLVFPSSVLVWNLYV